MPRTSPERLAYRRRLGVNLARVRSKATTFTQESIAERLGTDTETVGRWERGEREPKAYDVARMIDAYKVPAEWILDPTDSVTELDLRIARLRGAAAEAARAVAADEQAQRADGGRSARRGRCPA